MSGEQKVCYKCNKPGHFARECQSGGDGGGRGDWVGGGGGGGGYRGRGRGGFRGRGGGRSGGRIKVYVILSLKCLTQCKGIPN